MTTIEDVIEAGLDFCNAETATLDSTEEAFRAAIEAYAAEQVAQYKQDAERYRWLRQQTWDESEIACVMRPKDAVKLGHDCPSHERLDGAIYAIRAGGMMTTEPDNQKASYRCLFCGAPSWIEPSDQRPPPDYCHEEDHGTAPTEQQT